MDLTELSIEQARLGLKRRTFSCLDYVEALLAQSARHQGLNCFIWRDEESLRRSARAFDKAPWQARLAGIPLVLKDNIDVAGLPTTAGTGKLRGHIAVTDARITQFLFNEGALLAGKANMDELALGVTGNNGIFGPCRNPYAPTYIAGGSSGGCAGALAARLAPGAIGTDTSGSVRLPAALCGVVGFRPSAYRYPQSGIVPVSHTRDTAGPMARTVHDVALLDSILCGEMVTDELARLSPERLRLGVLHMPCWQDLEPGVEMVCAQALAKLEAARVTLVEVKIERLEELSAKAATPISLYELARDLPAYLRQNGKRWGLADLSEEIGSQDLMVMIKRLLAREVSDSAYWQALHARAELQRLYQICFQEHYLDALIFPTLKLTARPIGDDVTIDLNGVHVPTFTAFTRNTEPASIAGLPGISLPAGLSMEGLPVGLELDGAYNRDRALLAVAATVEEILNPVASSATSETGMKTGSAQFIRRFGRPRFF